MASLHEVKLLIKSILGSSRDQMTQADLYKQFREMIGYDIPHHKYGYRTGQEFLYSIPDTCILSGSGPLAYVTAVLSSESEHIIKMIANQKDNSKKSTKRKPKNFSVIVPSTSKTTTTEAPFQPPAVKPPCLGQFKQQTNVSSKVPLLPLPNLMPLACPASQPRLNNIPSLLSLNIPPPGQVPFEPRAKRDPCPPRFRKKQQNEVNQDKINGNHNGQAIDNQPTKLQPSTSTTTGNSYNNTLNHDINYKIPHVIQENLKDLIIQFPDGLWLRKFPEEYEKCYKQRFDYVKYGYTSLVQLCCSLPYIFKYKPLRKGDGKLYYVNGVIPDDKTDEMIELFNEVQPFTEHAIPNVEALPHVLKDNDYPPCVMLPGETIPLEVMPSIDEQLYTPIFIGEVYDLSKFWFSLADNEDKLEELLGNIEKFYNAHYKRYTISRTQLTKELYVILYKGGIDYSRGIVVNFDEFMVTIFRIDDGVIEKTTLANVYFMHKKFTNLRRQGLRARLARVMPPTKQAQWSRDAAYRFLQLIKEKKIYGSIDCVDASQTDKIYELVLCDSSGVKDIFIQDVLIVEGFAIPIDQEPLESSGDDEYVPIVNDLYLYPLFIEIETATVPTAMEMRRLIALRMPLHEIYPIYFKRVKEIIPEEDKNPVNKFFQRMKISQVENRAENECGTDRTSESDESPTCSDEMTETSVISQQQEPESQVSLIDDTESEVNQDGGDDTPSTSRSVRTPPGFRRRLVVPPFSQTQTNASPVAPSFQRPNYNGQQQNFNNSSQYSLNGNMSLGGMQPNVHDFDFHELPKGNDTIAQNLPLLQRQLYLQQQMIYNQNQQAYFRNQPNIPTPLMSPMTNSNYNSRPVSPASNFASNLYGLNMGRKSLAALTPFSPVNGLEFNSNVNNLRSNHKRNFNMAASANPPTAQAQTKKYVVTTTVLDKQIHIIRVRSRPCVVMLEIQEVFTGMSDVVLLRRLLDMSDVTWRELRLDSINATFLHELAVNRLITGSTIMYTCLGCLDELISCLTNEEYVVTNFDAMIECFSDNSPVWNAYD